MKNSTKQSIRVTPTPHRAFSRSRSYKLWTTTAVTAILASFAALSAGCGRQAYVVTDSAAEQSAPGSFSVAAKVDILLVQDDTGSSRPIFANISAQLATFLATLKTKGWDYHLATIPLTTFRSIHQVQASQYDPNWGAQWLPPYPGARANQVETVSYNAFRTPDLYTDFLTGADTSTSSQGAEIAFRTLKASLLDYSMISSGFLRPDAMLAVVLLSTGDDTSERNYCSGSYAQSDGYEGPCDLIDLARNGTRPSIPCGQAGANGAGYCNNYASSLLPYKTFLQNVKGTGNANKVRFYSISSSQHQVTGGNCMGTNAFQGARYIEMANTIGGGHYDICTTPIPNVLQGIASNLSAVQLNFYTTYLFMADRPEPTKITVWRNPGGDTSRRVQIPPSATNGWSYAGEVSNVYTTAIGSPTATPSLNLGSGFAVHLNGNGVIGGIDTATVEYQPYGSQNSAAP